MIEETITIGKETSQYSVGNTTPFCRRDTLLKAHNCIDKGDHYYIFFKYIDHGYKTPIEVRLTYIILK